MATRKKTRKAANGGAPWTPRDEKQLRKLAGQNTPTRLIAYKLGRTPAAIAQKASAVKLSLKPANRSPYGTV